MPSSSFLGFCAKKHIHTYICIYKQQVVIYRHMHTTTACCSFVHTILQVILRLCYKYMSVLSMNLARVKCYQLCYRIYYRWCDNIIKICIINKKTQLLVGSSFPIRHIFYSTATYDFHHNFYSLEDYSILDVCWFYFIISCETSGNEI